MAEQTEVPDAVVGRPLGTMVDSVAVVIAPSKDDGTTVPTTEPAPSELVGTGTDAAVGSDPDPEASVRLTPETEMGIDPETELGVALAGADEAEAEMVPFARLDTELTADELPEARDDAELTPIEVAGTESEARDRLDDA